MDYGLGKDNFNFDRWGERLMSRNMNKPFRAVMSLFAVLLLLNLGACSSDSGKEDEASSSEQVQQAEQMEQEGARDAGYEANDALVDVRFDFDKSNIKDDQRSMLDSNAEWIKAHDGVKVQIEGHCDERGTEEYNLALGESRANAVRDYLISTGIDGERLYTISYGEELPLNPGHDEAAWSENRRAHFLVTQ